jgi:hypothetical protein
MSVICVLINIEDLCNFNKLSDEVMNFYNGEGLKFKYRQS